MLKNGIFRIPSRRVYLDHARVYCPCRGVEGAIAVIVPLCKPSVGSRRQTGASQEQRQRRMRAILGCVLL